MRWRWCATSLNASRMNFELNPANDPSELAKAYAEKSRLQVRDIFTGETADEIHKALMGVDWWLTYNEGNHVHQLMPEQLQQLTRDEAIRIQNTAYANARSGYQFLYNYYPLYAAYFSSKFKDMPLFPIYEFINSPKFLDFVREMTGLEDIRWADGQATLYRATNFLKFHTDEQKTEKRRAAYVLNFTKDWDTDWGGLLQFWEGNGDIEHAFRPTFNALNIFTVPQPHSVSAVAPYAPGMRLSITGWIRADDPPRPFPAR